MQGNGSIHRKVLALVKRRLFGTITNISTKEQVVALTFDDGPHPVYTPRLLSILEKNQAHATFFVVGELAQKHPELIRKIFLAGHDIGNHSWNHPSFPKVKRFERWKQIQACSHAIAPYGQKLLRPPYGDQSPASRIDALLFGYKVIAWNIAGVDWLDHDAGWLLERLTSQIQPGGIILLHDGLYRAVETKFVNREPMLQAVEMLLEQLGCLYRFVTVSELFQYGHPIRKKWFQEAEVSWLNQLKKEL